LVRLLLFRTIHDVALMVDRGRSGREASPSAAVIDSQTVKAPSARTRGDDANTKIVGRKRHVAVDTEGRLLMVNLTPADVVDSTGAQAILDALRKRWPWIKHLFADGAYDRTKLLAQPLQEREHFGLPQPSLAFHSFALSFRPSPICRRLRAGLGVELLPLPPPCRISTVARSVVDFRRRMLSLRVTAPRRVAGTHHWSGTSTSVPRRRGGTFFSGSSSFRNSNIMGGS
jgi:hypothetical protein